MKRKLLLAMLCIVGCLSAHAQKDVTSQYITNATLSNGTTGWTVSNFNNPVSGNGNKNIVGDNNDEKSYNTIGYASEAYAGWNNLSVTSFQLTQKITLPVGNYTLVSYSFFRQGESYNTNVEKSLANLKAGDNQVPIKTLGSIQAAGYANSQIEGAVAFDSKMYRNTLDFSITADNTEIEIGLVGTFDVMRSWCIAGMFELINNDIPATMDAPFDVTGYLTNPGFEYRNMNGWTLSEGGAIGTQYNDQPFKTGFYYAEQWQPSANGALSARSMSQTLTEIPAGLYRLTANLGGDGTYLDLNENTAKWTADDDYTVSYVLKENEPLTITAGKTAEGSANWIHFDNFKLLYCGDVQAALTTICAKVSEYENKLSAANYSQLQTAVEAYNKNYSDVDDLLAAIDAVQALYDSADLYVAYINALTGAQEVDQNAKMSTGALSALQDAIATEVTMSSSNADIVSATQALNTATANANTSIINYVEAKAILEAANGYDEVGRASYVADETIAAIQSAYDNGSLVAVTSEQKAAAQSALATACKAQAQPADGCDMTAFIVNPGIDGNADGWNTEKKGNTNNTGGPLKPSKDAMEYWGESTTKDGDAEKGFDYYQMITGLPNGAYTISADMLNSTNGEAGAKWNGGGKAGLYGKTASDEKQILITTDGEQFLPYTTDEIFVIDGNLRIGVKNIAALTGRWFAVDNFKLTYARQLTAEEQEAIAKAKAKAVYEEALAAAQAIENGAIPATAYNSLQTVITNNTLEDATSTEYNNAATALNEAVEAAIPLVAPYAAWKDLKPQADALVEVSNNNATANGELSSAITAQNTATEAATTAGDITTATSTLKSAMITYIKAAEPTNDECFDLTFMLVNPHFTEGEGGMGKVAAGWTLESGTVTEHRLATHNFEAYHMTFNLSQTIKALPKGTYKVTLQGFARHDGDDKDKTNLYCGGVNQAIKSIKDEYSGTSLFSSPMEGTYCPGWGSIEANYDTDYELGGETVYQPNGMTGSYYFFQAENPATKQPFYTNEVQTFVTTAGDLKIGFSCETTTDWVIWDNFHLYYYGSAIDVTIDETVSKTFSEGIENATVTLNRTIKKGLNSVVLPFSMDQDEVEAFFGTGSKVYGVDGYNAEISSINFVTLDGIKANTPCILDAKEAGTSYKIAGRTIEVDEPTSTVVGLSFIGSYEASIDIEKDANNYILYNGKLYLVDSDDVTLKGTRAYFHVEGANAAREIAVTFDGGEATGIAEIDGEKVATGVMYNLAGQVVGDDYKGIVIIDGKKVLK